MTRDWQAAESSEITVIGIDRPTLDKDIQKIVGQFDWVVIDEEPLALYFYIERLVEQELKGDLGNNEHKDRQDTITGKNGEILATWKPNSIIFAKGVNIDKNKFNKILATFFASEN